MQDMRDLAKLIRDRNSIARRITEIIDRPAQIGHIGEYIASKVFDIRLEESAVTKGFDGAFSSGPLHGQTVNIKFTANERGCSTSAKMPYQTTSWCLQVRRPRR